MSEQLPPPSQPGGRPESPASLRRGGIMMLLLGVLLLSLRRDAVTYTVTAVGLVVGLAMVFSTQVLLAIYYVMKAVVRGPRQPPSAS